MKNELPLMSFARWRTSVEEGRVLGLKLYQHKSNRWGCITKVIDIEYGEIECYVGNWRGTNQKFLSSAGGWLTTFLGIIPESFNHTFFITYGDKI